MSAEISEIRGADGVAISEAIYRNDPAWHGLGTVFDSSDGARLTSERAIVGAHLGWHVEKRQAYILDHNGQPVPVKGQYATVRADNELPLGIVGERYHVLQNTEAFDFLDSLSETGELEYESAMALQEGRKIALLARIPRVATVGAEDKLVPYLLLTTAHDGSGSVDIFPTWVRVVCANTIRAARLAQAASEKAGDKNAWRVTVRHTASMTSKLDMAKRYIQAVQAEFKAYADLGAELIKRPVSPELSKRYIETLFPTPSEADGATQKALTIHQRRIESVREAFRHPSNQLEDMRGTWWQLMNAVTYTVDHNSRTRGRNEAQRAENRFLSVLDGNGANFKERAVRLALEMSA